MPENRMENASQTSHDDEIVRRALAYSICQTYEQGEKINLDSDNKRSFYFVKKGMLEVSYTADETKITVALLGPGLFFGEIGFFEGGSRIRDIRVVEKAEISVFTVYSMRHFQQKEVDLYCRFLTFLTRSICAKFRRILDENEPLACYGASLSSGGKGYDQSRPIPTYFLKTKNWFDINQVIEEFKAHFYDISHILQMDPSPHIPDEIKQRGFSLINDLEKFLVKMEKNSGNEESANIIWGYIFKEIFPYFMRSRFGERSYYKPKGYAGDFNMMEMLYNNKPEGDGKIGVLVDDWLLQTPAAKAIRGRRVLLKKKLAEFCQPLKENSDVINIMNLACGPNRELFDFLAECDYSEKISAICVDIDSEALQFTNQQVNTFPHRASIRLMSENLVKWALGRVQQNFRMQNIIYSSGLIDYLNDKLVLKFANRCFDHLKPGGKLMLGNFSPVNPSRTVMDNILQWKLIHRTSDDLIHIFNGSSFADQMEVISEEQGINLFAVGTKTAD